MNPDCTTQSAATVPSGQTADDPPAFETVVHAVSEDRTVFVSSMTAPDGLMLAPASPETVEERLNAEAMAEYAALLEASGLGLPLDLEERLEALDAVRDALWFDAESGA